MAQSQRSIYNKEKDLECTICMCDFTEPKLLACLHTFCMTCLKRYCEEIDEEEKPCPLCRTEFIVPEGGVEMLKTDQVKARLVLEKQTKEGKQWSSKCDACEEADAEAYCKDCIEFLCCGCRNAHPRVTSTRPHKIVSIDEKPSKAEMQKIKTQFCIVHAGEPIKLYCCDCEKLLCYYCHAIDHNKHVCNLPSEQQIFEIATVSTRAVVMTYDDSSKNWVQAGVSEGQSKVQIYHHPANNTFRVVARKLQDHEVVVNSGILKGLKYNRATPTFHQWRGRQQIYGLSFVSEQDAESFGQAMQCALDAISGGSLPTPPVQQPVSKSVSSHSPAVTTSDDMSAYDQDEGEIATVSTRAVVMTYDDSSKNWVQAGVSEGQSKVQIYHHPANNTFRVVARKLQDHEVVVNSGILKGLKYNRATPTFHQWRGRQQIYGLSFVSEQDAESFGQAMQCALDAISGGSLPTPPVQQPVSKSVSSHSPAVTTSDDMSAYDQDEGGSGQYGGRVPVPAPVAKVQPSVKQTPQPPAVPATQPPKPPGARAAAPPMPSGGGGGGPPPPPPPPPPPMGGGKAADSDSGAPQGGGLAAALAGAKLKKVAKPDDGDSGTAGREESSQGGGGSGGRANAAPAPTDMMSEMAKRLRDRKAKAENPVTDQPPPEPPSSSVPPPPFSGSDTMRVKQKIPPPAEPKKPLGNSSPSLNKRQVSPVNNNSTGGASDGKRSEELEALKQEIIAEVRNEMMKIKNEIIEAVTAAINNNR